MIVTRVPEYQKQAIRAFQRTAPVDVVGLARALGVQVWESSDLDGAAGKLFRDPINGGNAGYSILVNSADPLTRKRFTIAHEIAHFILHANQAGDITDDQFYRSGLGSQMEAEANRLAAEILMPSKLLEGLRDLSTRDTAQALNVSEMALSIRQSYLGREQFL